MMQSRTVPDSADRRRPSRAPAFAAALVLLCAMPAAAFAAVEVNLESMEVVSGSSMKLAKRLVGTVPSNVTDDSTGHLINEFDCTTYTTDANPNVTIGWTWSNAGVVKAPLEKAQYRVRLQPPGKSCDQASLTAPDPTSGCIEIHKGDSLYTSLEKQSFTLNLKQAIGDTKCNSGTETSAEVFFVIQYRDQTSAQQITEATSLKLQIDLSAPAPPTISSVSGGHQNVKLAWKHADTGTKKSRVYWSPLPFDAKAPEVASNKSDVLTATNYQITDLENEKTYYVAVIALDDAENESDAKEVLEARAVPVQDLWQYYKASGGASEGGYYTGCASGDVGGGLSGGSSGAGAMVLLGLCALLLVGLRRGRCSTVRVGRMALLAGIGIAVFSAPQQAHASSPRTASLDLRLSSYTPAIDTEFADNGTGLTPYADIMKEPAWLKSVTVDWLIFDGFGELSAGFGVGYWTQAGTGKAYDGSKTDDKTTLTVVPITLDVSYRFTVLAERFNFPLVPYGRIGAGYGLWWIYNGIDEVASYTDAKGNKLEGQGGVAGVHWSAGLRLLLDVFEPQAAKGFDMELGVNHSYLFVEFQRMSLNNFGGDKKAFDLSDDLIHFGLAFDL